MAIKKQLKGDNQLKKMSRQDLIDILLTQTEENERLSAENQSLTEELSALKEESERMQAEYNRYKSAFLKYGHTMARENYGDDLADTVAVKVINAMQQTTAVSEDTTSTNIAEQCDYIADRVAATLFARLRAQQQAQTSLGGKLSEIIRTINPNSKK